MCLILVVVNVCMARGFFLISPQRMGNKSACLNISLFGIAEILGYLLYFNYSTELSRKRVNSIYCIIAIIVSFLFSICYAFTDRSSTEIMFIDIVLAVFLRFFNAICTILTLDFVAECFPVNLKGLVFGITAFVGRLSMFLAAYIDVLGNYNNFNPLMFCFIPALLTLPIIEKLPETRKTRA